MIVEAGLLGLEVQVKVFSSPALACSWPVMVTVSGATDRRQWYHAHVLFSIHCHAIATCPNLRALFKAKLPLRHSTTTTTTTDHSHSAPSHSALSHIALPHSALSHSDQRACCVRLTHDGHVDLSLERYRRHLVGNLTAIDSVHIARLRREDQDVFDHLSGDRKREVQLYVVAVPVDLHEEEQMCQYQSNTIAELG